MKEVNVVADKFFRFAVRVVNLYKFLCAERKEFILSKQLLRSGTAIGALIINFQLYGLNKNRVRLSELWGEGVQVGGKMLYLWGME